MARPSRLTLVYAPWCGHCVPISIEAGRALADRLGIPMRRLSTDEPEEEAEADALVRDHGDWAPDYLIPQVFLELDDGRVLHLLTGDPSSLEGTRSRWARLLAESPGALVARGSA